MTVIALSIMCVLCIQFYLGFNLPVSIYWSSRVKKREYSRNVWEIGQLLAQEHYNYIHTILSLALHNLKTIAITCERHYLTEFYLYKWVSSAQWAFFLSIFFLQEVEEKARVTNHSREQTEGEFHRQLRFIIILIVSFL